MNAIQVYNSVLFYTDRTKGTRYYFSEINKAVQDATLMLVDGITDTANRNRLSGIDRIQMFRDELNTIMKSSTSVPTVLGLYNDDVAINHIAYPADYRTFAALTVTVDGVTTYGRDTNYSERGPLMECSFRKPVNSKVYFLEDVSGMALYRGITGMASGATLDYVKSPVDFNMGNEANLIGAGAGVLSLNTSYTAVDDSVYNTVVIPSGTVLSTNGSITTLTSGQVILTSLLTTIELPIKTHNQIAKVAASILMGITDDYEGSAFSEKQANQ